MIDPGELTGRLADAEEKPITPKAPAAGTRLFAAGSVGILL